MDVCCFEFTVSGICRKYSISAFMKSDLFSEPSDEVC